MCQKYSVTVIFYSIFHIKPQFFKTLFQSQLLFDFDDIFEAHIWNIHDLNTNLDYLSSNVLSLYCVFWVRNLVFSVEIVFGHCYFLLYISYKTTFKKKYSKVDSCSNLMIFLPTKAELNVVLHCNFSIIFFWSTDFKYSWF
jgi:hypothetical protein